VANLPGLTATSSQVAAILGCGRVTTVKPLPDGWHVAFESLSSTRHYTAFDGCSCEPVSVRAHWF